MDYVSYGRKVLGAHGGLLATAATPALADLIVSALNAYVTNDGDEPGPGDAAR